MTSIRLPTHVKGKENNELTGGRLDGGSLTYPTSRHPRRQGSRFCTRGAHRASSAAGRIAWTFRPRRADVSRSRWRRTMIAIWTFWGLRSQSDRLPPSLSFSVLLSPLLVLFWAVFLTLKCRVPPNTFAPAPISQCATFATTITSSSPRSIYLLYFYINKLATNNDSVTPHNNFARFDRSYTCLWAFAQSDIRVGLQREASRSQLLSSLFTFFLGNACAKCKQINCGWPVGKYFH